MRKFFFSVVLMVIESTSAYGQVQLGLVKELNSRHKPITAAQIHFAGASPTTSDQRGVFRLQFAGKKPGDYLFYTEIRKQGYELVNERELQKLTLSSSDSLISDIIMAKEGVVDLAKIQYYQLSNRALKASFDKAQRQVRAELQQARISQRQYEQQLKTLAAQYEAQEKELDQLAERLARINLDDASKNYQAAIEAFSAGNVDKALALLESSNPAAQIQQNLERQKQVQALQKEVASRKNQNQQGLNEDFELLRLNADLYVLNNQAAKAIQLYDQVLLIDSNHVEVLQQSADFFQSNQQALKALRLYNKILVHPKTSPLQSAHARGIMGDLYTSTGNLAEALRSYKTAQEYFAQQAVNQAGYTLQVVRYLRKMGISQEALENLPQAIQHYTQAEAALKTYAGSEGSLDFQLEEQAFLWAQQGIVRLKMGQWKEAIPYFETQSKNINTLIKRHPEQLNYQGYLAIANSYLGEAYFELGDFPKSLQHYQQSYDVFLGLAEKLPYQVNTKMMLATSARQMSQIQQELGNLTASLAQAQVGQQLLKGLVETYPFNVAFKLAYAQVNERVAEIYEDQQELHTALPFYQQEAQIAQELCQLDPQNSTFQNCLGVAVGNVASLQLRLGEAGAVWASIEQSFALAQMLYAQDTSNTEYQNNLAWAYLNKAEYYASQGDQQGVQTQLQLHLSALERLVQKRPLSERFQRGLINAHQLMGTVLLLQNKATEALVQLEKVVHLAKIQVEKRPGNSLFLGGLAGGYLQTSVALLALNQLDKAQLMQQKGLELAKSLDAAQPKTWANQLRLAYAYEKLGNIQVAQGTKDQALASFLAGINLLEARQDSQNAPIDLKFLLGVLHAKTGSLYLDAGKDEGRKYLMRAQALLQELVKINPNNPVYQQNLTAVQNGVKLLTQLDGERKAGDLEDKLRGLYKKMDREKDNSQIASLQADCVTLLEQRYDLDPDNREIKQSLLNAYSDLSWTLMLIKDYESASKWAGKGMFMSRNPNWNHTNYAYSMLLSGRKEEALKIITFLKDKPWGKTTYGQIMVKDLKALEKEGATHSDVREIIEMLK